MEKIKLVEATQLRDDIPAFKPGDTVKVFVKVVEGEKERVQEFQGLVIARRGSGVNATFVVRKVSDGVGVEAAKRVCEGCPVQERCLEYALRNRIDHGVWGGCSERQRRRILRARRLEAAA